MDALIVRRTPTRALMERPTGLFEDLDHWVTDVWDRWTPTLYYHRSSIPMEMYETKDDLVIKAELPGFRREDIDISLEGDSLTIKATSKSEELPEGATSYLCERCYGEYSRAVTLPFAVDSGKVEATYENGLLHLRLPKSEEVKPKHIEVKVK
jgi:HSP20 family protein